MTGGNIVLTPLPQADGQVKNRPALVLCRVRPFNDLMVCGISSQLRLLVSDFDEIISPGDEDFEASGLRTQSLIRLGYVSTVPVAAIKGQIGSIGVLRHRRMVGRLVDHLAQAVKP
jgi:mRNA interferase MazF